MPKRQIPNRIPHDISVQPETLKRPASRRAPSPLQVQRRRSSNRSRSQPASSSITSKTRRQNHSTFNRTHRMKLHLTRMHQSIINTRVRKQSLRPNLRLVSYLTRKKDRNQPLLSSQPSRSSRSSSSASHSSRSQTSRYSRLKGRSPRRLRSQNHRNHRRDHRRRQSRSRKSSPRRMRSHRRTNRSSRSTPNRPNPSRRHPEGTIKVLQNQRIQGLTHTVPHTVPDQILLQPYHPQP